MSLLSIEDGNPATSNVLYVNRCVWLQWVIGAYTGVQVGRGLAVCGILSKRMVRQPVSLVADGDMCVLELKSVVA